jgi:hypothetical protein
LFLNGNYVMVELLGNDLLKVRTLVAAAGYTGMESAVYEMLRSMARQKSFNPDDLPKFFSAELGGGP